MGKYLMVSLLFLSNNEVVSLIALTVMTWMAIFDVAIKMGGRT